MPTTGFSGVVGDQDGRATDVVHVPLALASLRAAPAAGNPLILVDEHGGRFVVVDQERLAGLESLAVAQTQENVSAPAARLTRREREVLLFIGTGCTVSDVAANLALARTPVEQHLSAACKELGVSSSRAAAAAARRAGLLGGAQSAPGV